MFDPEKGRLVLGTAQLGMEYGIANRQGRPDLSAARAIVQTAWEGGIREFDTARGYGESEKVLGQIFQDLGISREARVITKVSLQPGGRDLADQLTKAVEKSLDCLGVDRLYGIMLHQEDLLESWEPRLKEAFSSLLADGLTEHTGISVYSPARALEAVGTAGLSLVQVPANPLDRRFEKAGVFESAVQNGTTLYLRSVFLQGLLFMEPESIPARMSYAVPVLQKFRKIAETGCLELPQLALGFVKTAYPDTRILFGAEDVSQVTDCIAAIGKEFDPAMIKDIRETFPDVEEKLLNPALWPR